MNQQTVIDFIHQRMAEQGVENYHFEPLLIFAQKIAQEFWLYNEFWYLVDWTQNVFITSDTAIYKATATSLTFTGPAEFTGHVRIISDTDNNQIMFIRVIIQS